MKAMILAAGRGTRLGNLGQRIPKVLIEIEGRPLLERQLDYLQRNGVTHVVVNAHHQAAQIASFVQAYRGTLKLVCIAEQRLLGTAGGVRNALDQLRPGPFVVLYGDVLVDAPLEPLRALHQQKGGAGVLAVHDASSALGKGVVEVDESGRIRGFSEKGSTADGPFLINSGVYVLEPDFVATVPPGVESDFGSDVFPAAVERGVPLYAARLPEAVIDMGTPEGLDFARATVRARALGSEAGPR
jgi:NDP-sugar pyrophosphorylase family protein